MVSFVKTDQSDEVLMPPPPPPPSSPVNEVHRTQRTRFVPLRAGSSHSRPRVSLRRRGGPMAGILYGTLYELLCWPAQSTMAVATLIRAKRRSGSLLPVHHSSTQRVLVLLSLRREGMPLRSQTCRGRNERVCRHIGIRQCRGLSE